MKCIFYLIIKSRNNKNKSLCEMEKNPLEQNDFPGLHNPHTMQCIIIYWIHH